jgi:ABC-type glycerol-3-phosphate transport system substrate-binding protein
MGANCSVIYPECRIAISSKSSSKDGAWDFVKTFLTEEYQDKLGEYNFPLRKSSLDKMGEASMQKEFYMEDGQKIEYDDTYYVDDMEIVIDPLTAEEVQEVKDFIASITLVYSVNDSVNAIIQEEASAFYSGQKTAQEVADIIQSRVSIYVNENS